MGEEVVMVSLHTILKWMASPRRAIGLSILIASFMLLGCESDVRDDCGGVGSVISCVSVDRIVPTDGREGAETSNVTAVATCSDGEPAPITDHFADITFSNRQFPASTGDVSGDGSQVAIDGSFLLTILHYSVSYSLNDCPPRATGCPALTGFSVSPGQTFTIPNNGNVEHSFPMVPLRVKEEYVAEGGHLGSSQFGFPFPSYTATYSFTGRTDFFSDEIHFEGSTEFTIGSFENCN